MKPMNQCPHCGANLDPCERCDCMENDEDEKGEDIEKGTAHANDASPRTVSSYLIISQVFRECKCIQVDKQIPLSENVETVRQY